MTTKSAVWIALWPTAADARLLAVHGGVPATKLHLTLGYVPCANAADATRVYGTAVRIAEAMAPNVVAIDARLGAVGVFKNETPTYFVAVQSSAVRWLRDRVVDTFERDGIRIDRTHSFAPHVTLRRGAKPTRGHMRRKITFDALRVYCGDEYVAFRLR